MTSQSEIRAAWLSQLLSTDAADRSRAEAGLRRLYAAANFAAPQHFLWFDSPFDASWAVALLLAPHHFLWRDRLAPSALSRDDRQRAEHARSALSERLKIADWNRVLATVGRPRGAHLQFPPDPGSMFSSAFLQARYALVDDVSSLFKVYGDDDDLARAETYFWGSNRGALRSALHCPTTDGLIGQSFVEECSFSRMADDEHRVDGREPPPILGAAWDVARSAGLWWPFENAAIMSDRPSEIHVNERQLLHRGDGPAVVYRDGRQVYAWNGKAVPERWIVDPGAVPPRELKGFDPTFRKYVETRVGKPTKKAAARSRTGRFIDRYRGGEHRQVWADLVALGPRVREESHMADALAVANETMQRVDANVRTLVQRLADMNFVFANVRPHAPPAPGIRKAIATFEKEAGAIPLSLRAFYEVVGEVNFVGAHPTLVATAGTVAPDPLVVYGFHDGLVEYDEDESPSAITIAPDDLHKANVSGGDAYELAIPDPRADGELLNERHSLFFVDYLRLCFGFGGFPGYEGAGRIPSEIAALSDGLLEF